MPFLLSIFFSSLVSITYKDVSVLFIFLILFSMVLAQASLQVCTSPALVV